MKFNNRILKDTKFMDQLEKYYQYDGWETRYNHFLRILIVDNLSRSIKIKGTALDVGCSSGGQSFILEKAGFDVIGMDRSDNGLKKARVWAKEIGSKARFELGDAVDLSYKDESFDLVLASEVLEHIDDNKKAAREIYRITKKGGHIIYTLPNGSSKYWMRKKREFERENGKVDISNVEANSKEWHILRHMMYTPKDIRKITSKGLKLKEVSSTSCGLMIPPLSILIRILIMTGYGYKKEISHWNDEDKATEGASYVIMYEKFN